MKPDIYYEPESGSYYLAHCERFMRLDKANLLLHLRSHTIPESPAPEYTRIEWQLVESQRHRTVDYAGRLAGHRTGAMVTNAGYRVVVTSECAAFTRQPSAGECPTWEDFLSNLLPDGQHVRFMDWLSVAWKSLLKGDFRPGQMLVLAGPAGCGKSLCQALITEVLGGRVADPYQYMTGGTAFNGHLAEAEHLAIEDQYASTDMRSRRKFGASVKELTVNETLNIHRKGRQAVTLRTYRRLTGSVNDEAENLAFLPPFDASIADKITLLRCAKAKVSDDRAKAWGRFMGELPAFLRILKLWRVAKSCKCPRYGVKAWHHPELLVALAGISYENRLLEIADLVLGGKRWAGTASELEERLLSSQFAGQVAKLCYYPSACGVYLARLAAQHPDRIRSIRSEGKTRWAIDPAS